MTALSQSVNVSSVQCNNTVLFLSGHAYQEMEKAELLLLLDLILLALFDERNNTGDKFPVISACQNRNRGHEVYIFL